MNIVQIKIDISAEDIKEGRRNNPNFCPVAKSIRRHFPNAYGITVRPFNDPQSGTWWPITIRTLKMNIRFNLAKDVIERIKSFDKTGIMEPFSFEVSL